MRKATAADVPAAARSLARAFQDDPAMSWAIPSAARRTRYGERYFAKLISRFYLPKDEVYVAGDGLAAALWSPPGPWRISTVQSLPLFPTMVKACRANLPRTMRMLALMEKHHGTHDEPHFYLPFVGVDPSAQGRGLGTALLTTVLDRCDEERIPAYLEASSPGNQALYFRHGFTVIDELTWPGGGPPFWPMWRTPR